MNVLVDIDFVTGHEYYASQTVDDYDSKQWLGKIVGDVSLSYGVGDNYDFEVDVMTVKLNDSDRRFRTYINDINNRHIIGRDVVIYTHDGTTGTERRTMEIVNYSFEPVGDLFVLKLGFKLFQNIDFTPELINDALFNTLPEVTRNANLLINYCFGYFLDPSSVAPTDLKDTVKAPRVLNTPTGTRDYVVGKVFPAADLTPGGTLHRMFKPDGTDISALCTLTLHTDGFTYVNYINTTEDYIRVHLVPIANYAFLTLITDILDVLSLAYDTNEITDIFDLDKSRSYTGNIGAIRFRFLINSKVTKNDVLVEICKQAEMEYYVDADKKIHFRAILYEALTVNHTYTAIPDYNSFTSDESMIENKIIANSGKNPATGSYEVPITYNDYDAQGRSGIVIPKTVNYPMTKYPVLFDNSPPLVASKFRLLRRRNATLKVNIDVNLTHISQPDGLIIKPLDIISFPHPKALTETPRIYQVRRLTQHFTQNITTLDLYDIEDFKNYYTGYIMRLTSNNNEADKQFFNSSPKNSQVFIVPSGGTVRHTTGVKKFGASSIFFAAGAADYINGFLGDIPDPMQYPILVYSCWVNLNADNVNYGFFNTYGDGDNRFYLQFQAANDNLNFFYRIGAATVVNFISDNNVLAAASGWQHVILAKIGTDWGMYVDGDQVGYLDYTHGGGTVSGLYRIGTKNDAAGSEVSPINAYKDDIMFADDNDLWNLAPVVGKTDTYDVPTKQLNIYGLQ